RGRPTARRCRASCRRSRRSRGLRSRRRSPRAAAQGRSSATAAPCLRSRCRSPSGPTFDFPILRRATSLPCADEKPLPRVWTGAESALTLDEHPARRRRSAPLANERRRGADRRGDRPHTPARTIMGTPMQYLDKALTRLRDLGLVPERTEEAPIVALLNRVSDLDEDKIVSIARTLSQASLFNQVVREQISSMELGERYERITNAFDSIRKDARSMVEQLEDGKI